MTFGKTQRLLKIDMIRVHLYLIIIWVTLHVNAVTKGPAYYTPYMEDCDWEGARNASRASNKSQVFKNNEVHGGFFTVDKNHSMNLFSVLIKSAKNSDTAPLILWTQGQPGCTALYAIFGQNGPSAIDKNNNFHKKICAWTDKYNVLYLDNMIFTGFSYAEKADLIPLYLNDIGHYLYEALFQFYQIFPELQKNDLYLAGEMYSGKYLLLLGQMIHKRNPVSHVKMPLKGFYLGSALVDAENQMGYSMLLYQLGLIEYDRMKDMEVIQETIRRGIRSKRFDTASQQYRSIFVLMETYGFKYPMDFTRPNVSYDWNIFNYLNSSAFRNTFGLGSLKFYSPDKPINLNSKGKKIPSNLVTSQEEDILVSAKSLLPPLLEYYRFLFYSGQFDLWVPYVHVVNFLRLLRWKGAEEYYSRHKSPRYNWCANGRDLSGYWKTASNLSEVLVMNANQMIDASQPLWACNLLSRFINNDFKSNPESCPKTLHKNSY